jgi:hypothetical protein
VDTAEYLRTIDLDGIAGLVEPVTWFVPFWGIMFIYLNAFALAGGIRTIRFLIGFIPTVEG